MKSSRVPVHSGVHLTRFLSPMSPSSHSLHQCSSATAVNLGHDGRAIKPYREFLLYFGLSYRWAVRSLSAQSDRWRSSFHTPRESPDMPALRPALLTFLKGVLRSPNCRYGKPSERRFPITHCASLSVPGLTNPSYLQHRPVKMKFRTSPFVVSGSVGILPLPPPND